MSVALTFPFRGVTDPLITTVFALREGVVLHNLEGACGDGDGFLRDHQPLVNTSQLQMDCDTYLRWNRERSPCLASFSVRHARRHANNSAYLSVPSSLFTL